MKALSSSLIGLATVAVCFGCASKKKVADTSTTPTQVADLDTATKYDINPPAYTNANLGASSSGRSR